MNRQLTTIIKNILTIKPESLLKAAISIVVLSASYCKCVASSSNGDQTRLYSSQFSVERTTEPLPLSNMERGNTKRNELPRTPLSLGSSRPDRSRDGDPYVVTCEQVGIALQDSYVEYVGVNDLEEATAELMHATTSSPGSVDDGYSNTRIFYEILVSVFKKSGQEGLWQRMIESSSSALDKIGLCLDKSDYPSETKKIFLILSKKLHGGKMEASNTDPTGKLGGGKNETPHTDGSSINDDEIIKILNFTINYMVYAIWFDDCDIDNFAPYLSTSVVRNARGKDGLNLIELTNQLLSVISNDLLLQCQTNRKEDWSQFPQSLSNMMNRLLKNETFRLPKKMTNSLPGRGTLTIMNMEGMKRFSTQVRQRIFQGMVNRDKSQKNLETRFWFISLLAKHIEDNKEKLREVTTSELSDTWPIMAGVIKFGFSRPRPSEFCTANYDGAMAWLIGQTNELVTRLKNQFPDEFPKLQDFYEMTNREWQWLVSCKTKDELKDWLHSIRGSSRSTNPDVSEQNNVNGRKKKVEKLSHAQKCRKIHSKLNDQIRTSIILQNLSDSVYRILCESHAKSKDFNGSCAQFFLQPDECRALCNWILCDIGKVCISTNPENLIGNASLKKELEELNRSKDIRTKNDTPHKPYYITEIINAICGNEDLLSAIVTFFCETLKRLEEDLLTQ